MSERYRVMKLALQLHLFAKRMKEQQKESWGFMTGYSFHAPGRILYFHRISEIEEMAKKIARRVL